MTQTPLGNKRRRIFSRWWFRLTLLLLVAGLGWYGYRWLWGPHEFRLVGRFPVYGINENNRTELTPSGTMTYEFLKVSPSRNVWQWRYIITSRGWDGKVRWTVTLPQYCLRDGKEELFGYDRHFSPDYRTLVSYRIDVRSVHILCWRDGILRSDITLSGQSWWYASRAITIMPTDDGRVWCYYYDERTSPIAVIDGQQVAMGIHTAHFTSVGGFYGREMAPDGACLISYDRWGGNTIWEYCTVGTRGRQVNVTHRYTTTLSGDYIYPYSFNFNSQAIMLNHGIVLSERGAIFRETGRMQAADNWYSRVFGESLLQFQEVTNPTPGNKAPAGLQYYRTRVIVPRRRDTWDLPIRQSGGLNDFFVSDDGRLTLVAEARTEHIVPRPVARLLSKWPNLLKRIDNPRYRLRLLLYERPGTQRAFLDCQVQWQNDAVYYRWEHGRRYRIYKWQFSNDGKYLSLYVKPPGPGFEWLVYRW